MDRIDKLSVSRAFGDFAYKVMGRELQGSKDVISIEPDVLLVR